MRLKKMILAFLVSSLFSAPALSAVSSLESQSQKLISSVGTVGIGKTDGNIHLNRYTAGGPPASDMARYFDMIQTHSDTVASQIHALRPDFKVLRYRNARAVYPYVTEEWEYFRLQNWVLKDANNQYVYSTRYGPSAYMMVDIGNTAYQDWLANKVKTTIAQYGHDGVFLDNGLQVAATSAWYEASATPLNPRTNQPWTDLEIKTAYISILQKVKAGIGSKLLVPNGIWNGIHFYSASKHDAMLEVLQNTQLDGVMSEGIWNTYNGLWFTVADWKKSLDFFIWIEENFLKGTNKVFVPVVGESNDPAGSTHLQLATYGLASTLLAISPGEEHVYLVLGGVSFMAEYGQALFDKANSLGNPIGDYYVSNGVYIRVFDHGKVYVNPTGTTISVESITIEAHTGKIV